MYNRLVFNILSFFFLLVATANAGRLILEADLSDEQQAAIKKEIR